MRAMQGERTMNIRNHDATSYIIQSAGALTFVPLQYDLFYDLMGMVGFLASTFVSLFYEGIKEGKPLVSILESLSTRHLLLNGAAVVWSLRLGVFLFSRAIKLGGDSRLEEIKRQPLRFATVWFMQGTWTFLVGLPLYLTNLLCTPSSQAPIGKKDYIPLGLFTSSLFLEILADYQKSKWRDRRDKKKHNERFISSGIWRWSRHPNYIGEIGIWMGIWALSASALQHSAYPRLGPALAAASPLFTWHLLTNVSGIPLLEKHAKKTFGDDPKYKDYARSFIVAMELPIIKAKKHSLDSQINYGTTGILDPKKRIYFDKATYPDVRLVLESTKELIALQDKPFHTDQFRNSEKEEETCLFGESRYQ
ncbi:hypothetical protein Clacol_002315 [Clathrus columnatus]|uniref:Steroid 5-alpha reductase C-terminal domain-containing protein n=1 Tax=Clathrus columnatus TaxID=1419009 RepID=A0AAV5A3A9_9AGAM|nr:hypothetical protein Clacol_002315 [Clathrus columnatus]